MYFWLHVQKPDLISFCNHADKKRLNTVEAEMRVDTQLKILVVDDLALIRTLVRRSLLDLEIQNVHEAADGA